MTNPIKMLNPLEIETTAGTQSRVSVRQKIVDEYAEDMRNGDMFPPIHVFAEEGSERYVLASGFHRLQAHIAAHKDRPISAELHTGNIWDAKVFAARENAEHGVRRTNKDVRHAIRMLLLDPESSGYANTIVAEWAKCGHVLVAKVKEQMILDGDIDAPTKRKELRKGKEVEVEVKQAKSKKKAKKKTTKKAEPAKPKSQDEYDREEIVTALDILKGFSGKGALEKYSLTDRLPDIEASWAFLDDILAEVPAEEGEDQGEEEFLKVS